MKSKKIYIYGKHSVAEVLMHAPSVVRKIELSAKMQDKNLLALIRASGVDTSELDERKITSQVEGKGSHQGIVALVSLSGLLQPFEKFFEIFSPTPETALVFLSEIQDPHNVGAIIRSAAAFGASAVLMPTHKQASITGALIKASAGMAFRVPLIAVDNVQQGLAKLKSKGVVIYGLEARGGQLLNDQVFGHPALFAFGNEGDGIAPNVLALCDKVLSIPIDSRAESLNVAAATAVTLYAWKQKNLH